MKTQALLLILAICEVIVGLPLAEAEVWDFTQVVKYAEEHTPESSIARARVKAAEAKLGEAYATLWPKLQVQSGYAWTDNPIGVFGSALNQRKYTPSLNFNDVPDADNLNVRGSVTYPLFTGGRNAADRAASRAGLESAQWSEKTVRRDFGAQAAILFFQILKAEALVRAEKATVRAFETNEKAARARVAAGTALRTDLLDMQVQLAQAREDLVAARNAKRIMEESLKSFLAVDDDGFAVQGFEARLVEPSSPESGDVRSELKAAAAQIDLAEARRREARAGYFPRISAIGAYEYNRGWEFDGDGVNYTAGVAMEWDLWDGRLTHHRTDEAESAVAIAQAQERRAAKMVQLEQVQERLKLDEVRERLSIALEAEKLSKESASITRSRFQEGLASTTQLIDAERALATAQVRSATAENDQRIAIVALRNAYGLGPLE